VSQTGRLAFTALFVYLLSFLLFAVACTGPEPEMASENRVKIPWTQSNKQGLTDDYKWTEISLQTLSNVRDLRGSSARFIMSPLISGSQMTGPQPRLRGFLNRSGAWVASDDLSLNLLTLYAHIEKLLQFDRKAGVGDLLQLPRTVGVQVRLLDDGVGNTDQGLLTDNALYSPKLDAFLFLPFKAESFPLIVNSGVIAHEHFHALFHHLLGQYIESKIPALGGHLVHDENTSFTRSFGLTPDPKGEKIGGDLEGRDLYHRQLLRGINEGLADVWGFLYSSDPIFVQRSRPEMHSRNLSLKAISKIASRQAFLQQSRFSIRNGRESNQFVYDYGSEIARSILQVAKIQTEISEDAKIKTAVRVLDLVRGLKTKILSLGTEDWLEPSVVIELAAKSAKDKAECGLWLERLDSSEK
jgi:hypothetical protein